MSWLLDLFSTRPLLAEIKQFSLWKEKRHPHTAAEYTYILQLFAKAIKARSYKDIKVGDINAFLNKQNSVYLRERHRQVVSAFMQFSNTPSKRGRPVDIKHVRATKRLKEDRGLSYRQIAAKLSTKTRKIDPAQVVRWYKYSKRTS